MRYSISETLSGVSPISIQKSEYESLVRDSERLKIIREYISKNRVTDKFVLLQLINAEEREGE